MRIAVVGAGKNCMYLMDVIEKYKFKVISPVVVAVADIDSNAPGLVKARKKGLVVTEDYNDFFQMKDIDLIVELTGNLDIYDDIVSKKNSGVRVIAHTTARLFWEIDHAASMHSKANKDLAETQALYDLMINGLMHEDVVVISTDHRILDINKTFLFKLGLTRQDVLGRYCYEITHHQDIPCTGSEHPCPLAEVKKTGRASRTTHTHKDHDGSEHYVSISCYPLFEQGELKAVIEVSKDITSEIEFEKNMMQQEKLVSIGRLSAGVAHEINNPLTTILTSSMLMQEDLEPGSDMHNELTIISNEVLRCRKIVKSLLDFARQSKSVQKKGNLNEVIKESLILTRKQAKFKDVSLTSELGQELPLVEIDSDKIQQTIINLVLNAIEATPPGGGITISSCFLEQEKKVQVTVSDTGEGIDTENLDRIFDPFFTTKKSGTGLGLAITHGIIEQHGGNIKVNSTSGLGTTFFIKLPLTRGTSHDR